jgi:predicted DNA-binding protein
MPLARKNIETKKKYVRRSVSIPKEIDTRVKTLARQQNRSANQTIESLIETGLQAREEEKRRFFEAAERFKSASTPSDIAQTRDELARLIFGS